MDLWAVNVKYNRQYRITKVLISDTDTLETKEYTNRQVYSMFKKGIKIHNLGFLRVNPKMSVFEEVEIGYDFDIDFSKVKKIVVTYDCNFVPKVQTEELEITLLNKFSMKGNINKDNVVLYRTKEITYIWYSGWVMETDTSMLEGIFFLDKNLYIKKKTGEIMEHDMLGIRQISRPNFLREICLN